MKQFNSFKTKIKKQYKLKRSFLFATILLIGSSVALLSNSSGPASAGNGGRTGAPGEGNCSNCHSGGTSFTPSVVINVYNAGTTTPATSYVGGTTYDVKVTVSSTTGAPKFGFQLTTLSSSNVMAGSYSTPSSNTKISTASSRDYLEHNATSTSGVFTAKWVAPASGTGTVKFYAYGNCVNGTFGTSGDNAIGTSLSLTESVVCTPTASTINDTICSGTSYTFNGMAQTTGGTYLDTLINAGGCDSVVTLNLSINPLPNVTATAFPNDTVCEGNPVNLQGAGATSYTWNGNMTLTSDTIFSTSIVGTYTVVGSDANMCSASSTIQISNSNKTIFLDGLEAGTLNSNWILGTGNYITTVDNVSPAVGNYSLHLNSTSINSINQGIMRSITPSQPEYISWWAKTNTTNGANGYFLIGDNDISSNLGIIFCYFNSSSSLRFFNTTGYNHPIVANTWYHIEAKNINWTTKKMDIYVNNVLILSSWAFRNTATTEVSKISLYSLVSATSDYDQILVGDAPFSINASVSPSSNVCTQTPIILQASPGAISYTWNGNSTLTKDSILVATNNATYTVSASDAYGCVATKSVSITVNPVSSLAPITASQSQNQIDGSNLIYSNSSCELISSVNDGSGGNVLGSTISLVTIEPTIPTYNNQAYCPRWFTITPTNQGPATVTLYQSQADFNVYNSNNGTLPNLPTGPSDLAGIANIRITQVHGTGVLGSANTIKVITPITTWNATNSYWEMTFPVDSFSSFYFHSVNPNNAALPVTLLSFTGKKEARANVLNWTTSQEQNNAYFNVQHSQDARSFTTIAKVTTKAINGSSSSLLNYELQDENPKVGHNYYRLQQVDNDGKSTLSQVIDLYRDANGNVVNVYPNPTSSILNVECLMMKEGKKTIKLSDLSGRVIKEINTMNNSLQIDMNALSTGIYMLQVEQNNQIISTQKVEKR